MKIPSMEEVLAVSGEMCEQNRVIKQAYSDRRGFLARMSELVIGRNIEVQKIADYEDGAWGTITPTVTAAPNAGRNYYNSRGFGKNWDLTTFSSFSAARTRPQRTQGRVVGVNLGMPALVIKPSGPRRNRIGARHWVRMMNPDGEPLVQMEFDASDS
jgi:hypothetical protein